MRPSPNTEPASTSTCARCGASFGCAMAGGSDGPCWCTQLPPLAPVPGVDARCWCPACLRQHLAAQGSAERTGP